VPDYREGGREDTFLDEAYLAESHRGRGVWLELGSGVLMIATAAGSLLLSRREPEPERPSRRAAAEGSAA
jgi:hypothetical protein